ncbi:site-specific integrase [Herbiconiux moechotypicola]|uniref:Site-specific integrase n=1 Tax=Herbiconiux moechotypicola TaxID=637393 RepID=A0ABN3DLZ8_9MICO|nr:site-specific integrase [Herbiconiux moechotypicola]MCS5730217.1 site-specific integrase [Herbiconiux moechotypicola]
MTALKLALVSAQVATTTSVSRETRLSELADRFLASKANRAPRTIDTYRQTIAHHIKPKIGSLSVTDATTERLDQFVRSVSVKNGPGAAKACRAVLSGMMGMAARADAVRVNPVREIGNIERHRKGAEAIPIDDLAGLLSAVRGDQRLAELDEIDVIEFLAATGCRLGEVLAVKWSAIDFSAGTVTISANVVRANGHGVLIQDHVKTRAGMRTISIPESLVDRLRDRRVNFKIHNEFDLVFPTIRGNIRDPRNTSRDWRDARERLGYPTVTTHSFRKTVATALDSAGLSAREIAEYLGHANPSLTQDVYMAKNTGGVRAARALESIVK